MNQSPANDAPAAAAPKPLTPLQRRILGVLMEKARTTPDAYPLSLNAIVTGCNQKSNRQPVMTVEHAQVEDELINMRQLGLVAEVHGGGRVAKYRHFGYDHLGVKGPEAGIMTELLLRGEQTAGELRSRASRFEPIEDLPTLKLLLQNLMDRDLVITLASERRSTQLYTHNLYLPNEMDSLRQGASQPRSEPATPQLPAAANSAADASLATLREELATLRELYEALADRVSRLES